MLPRSQVDFGTPPAREKALLKTVFWEIACKSWQEHCSFPNPQEKLQNLLKPSQTTKAEKPWNAQRPQKGQNTLGFQWNVDKATAQLQNLTRHRPKTNMQMQSEAKIIAQQIDYLFTVLHQCAQKRPNQPTHPSFRVAPVRFGYGSKVERFERFWFSVPAVPPGKGGFCVSVQFNREVVLVRPEPPWSL